jgi:hypothetical protein
MNQEFPNIKEKATIGELYDPAIEIAKRGDKKKAKKYFDALVEHCVETSKIERPQDDVTFTDAVRIVHSNIGYWAGYWAGYFEKGMIEKVHEVFGSAHPVFGTETPTPTEAFNAGLELGKSMKND